MENLLKHLAALLRLAFGSLSWTPPSWLSSLVRHSQALLIRRVGPALKTPRGLALAAGILVLIGGGLGAWHLWHRPSGLTPLEVTVEAPRPPPPPSEQKDAEEKDEPPSPSPLRLSFDHSAAPLENVGKSLAEGPILTPPIEGEWRWRSDQVLEFTPKQPWPLGQGYKVRFPKGLLAPHVEWVHPDPRFSTAGLEARFDEGRFYQDPRDPRSSQVVATLRFNYPVDAATLEPRIELKRIDPQTRTETVTRFEVTYDKAQFAATIHSERLAIPPIDQTLKLVLNEGVQAQVKGPALRERKELEVPIPGRFSLLRVEESQIEIVRNEQDAPEQVLGVAFTAGVGEAALSQGLTAFLLPVDKPAEQGAPIETDYAWSSVAEISPEILKRSTPVRLTPVPGDDESQLRHLYRIQAPPERHLYIKVDRGLEALGGYQLGKAYDAILEIPRYPAEVRIMHEGALLAVGGERRLNVVARGVSAVRVKLARILPDALNHLLSQSSGNFESPYFRGYRFNEENLSESFTEVHSLDGSDPERAQYLSVDFGKYLKSGSGRNRGLFFLTVQAWDPVKNRPARPNAPGSDSEEADDSADGDGVDDSGGEASPTDRRFVLVTDLGALVKTDVDDHGMVFVQSIASGRPVADAQVEVLGKNGIPVLSRRSDAQGVARFPSLKSFTHEKQPVAYVIRHGADLSFLPIRRSDRDLDFSRFEVGGVQTRGRADTLSAFLFSDRGLYRPGETFHVAMMVKPVDWSLPVKGVPVQVEITDPQGLPIKTSRLELPASGFVEFDYTPESSAPTGTYSVTASLVPAENEKAQEMEKPVLGSTTVSVEEFLPDRLRIDSRILDAPSEGWMTADKVQVQVSLQNLFGTPASQHRVTGGLTLRPRFPSFSHYPDYTFYARVESEDQQEMELEARETDAQGLAVFDLDLSHLARATLQLRFSGQGYELEGGRGVSTGTSILVSPLPYLVGYKADGDLSYLKKGSHRELELIAIDPHLKKLSVENLTTQIIEHRWVSTLVRQGDGTYKYESIKKELPGEPRRLDLAATGTRYRIPTQQPGSFVLVLRDAQENELNRVPFQVVGEANLTRNLERNAELRIKLDRESYAPGESIEIQITAPYVGAGLITIERDKVFATQWFKTTTTSSVQRITVPPGLEGNGYVNVAFVRSMASPEIFMSPLSYGVAPFSVDRRKRTLPIDLKAPQRVRPGETIEISYKTDRPAKLVLYGVDEGILQVAHYKTPKPLDSFFSKRALEVGTRQILDLILPEYRLSRSRTKVGGDEDAGALANNLNPFKRKTDAPVVFWSGIVEGRPSAQTFAYRVPDSFNGTLRIMAVAVSPDALGVASAQTLVRGPLTLTPHTPLFVGPGDTFEASVGVANHVEGSGEQAKVQVSLATSGGLEILGEDSKTLPIAEHREAATRYSLRAADSLGNAEFLFTAQTGKERVRSSVTTSVRPPTPYRATTQSGSLQDGSVELPLERVLYDSFARRDLLVSPLPLSLAQGPAIYLENSPSLSTEQLVSTSIPSLILSEHPGFGLDPTRARATLSKTFSLLQARQNAEGSFGTWAANSHGSDVQTIDATLFLIEARERGHAVPSELEARALTSLQGVVKRPLASLSDARLRAQALYVLARGGRLASVELAELAEFLRRAPDPSWKREITGVYLAATHQLMQNADEAMKGIRAAEPLSSVTPDEATDYDTQAYLAQYLYVVAKHFPSQLKSVEKVLLQGLGEGIAAQRYHTSTAAWSIWALEAYGRAVGTGARSVWAKTTVFEVREGGERIPLPLSEGVFSSVSFSAQAKSLRIQSSADAPLFYAATQAGFDRAPPTEALKQGLELIHLFEDGAGNPVQEVALGEIVRVHLRVRTLGGGKTARVAIVDLFPAGFEFEGFDPDVGGFRPDFTDAREDRLALYGSVDEKVQEFVYRLRAVSRGTFHVPPSYAQGQYDRTLQGRSLGGEIQVSERK